MLLRYNADITENSRWLVTTPNDTSKKLPFYMNEIGHFMCNKDYYTEREGQKNYFLMYTISGSGYLKYRKNEYFLTAGTVALINCNDYQYYKTHSEEQWNYRWVHFNGSSAKTYMELLNGNSLSVVTIDSSSDFEKIFEKLMDNVGVNDITANINVSMYITELLSKCVASKLSSNNNKAHFQHKQEIELVINYITTNYDKKITLDDLCDIIHVSKFHFLKLFKTYTGFTPYGYLINHRINKAKQLLKNTDGAVSEVCINVGFNDESSFIKQFKMATGYTPLNYRRFL